MRIAFLSQEYPPYGPAGGIGSYSSVVAPALARRGHDVHVIVCHDGEKADLMHESVHVHLRPKLRIPLLGAASRLSQTHERLVAARSASKALAELGAYDVIESPEWMAEALFVRRADRKRLVIHLHTSVGLIARYGGYGGRDVKVADALEIASMRRAAVITSPSQLLFDTMLKSRALKSSEKVVIRLPIELENWPAETRGETERVVAVIGRLEQRKGIDVLIEALSRLPESLRDTKLVAVGRSSGARYGHPYSEFLQHLAERRGVRFEHKPQLSRSQIVELYPHARVVAVPSRFESFSVSALEAMASSVPVVCTRMCGVGEVIAGSEAGAVVAAEDPVALMEALVPYLTDRTVADRAGRAGRALVETACSADVIAGQREEMYAAVAR